jgi:hypothetical protein
VRVPPFSTAASSHAARCARRSWRALGTNRTPIPEALLLLKEGLMNGARNRGTTVRAY